MKMRCLAAVLLAGALGSHAQERPQAFLGARLLPISGPEIADGVLIVQRGKIVAVGPRSSVRIPADALRHDVTGSVLMPGLVDTHSHIGGPEGADSSAPIQPEVRVLDSIDVRDARLQKAQAGGITTVNVMPGSGHLLSGQTVYLKLRDRTTIEELLLTNEKGLYGGLKMANGTNSRRAAPFPGTRGKSAALVREQFVKAQEYRRKWAEAGDDAKKRPARDLGLEALVEVLEGRRIVHHHTHRHDDVLTVLRLAKEFGFRVVLHHVSDAAKVAKEIAAARVPCSLIVVDSPGGKLEATGMDWGAAAALKRAGGTLAFHTDDGIVDSRFLFRAAALAVRAGLDRQSALEALTLAGARMLDLGTRVGSLETGKDADFVLLSGDPFSTYTRVLQTWVEGEPVFDRERPQDRLYATGGFGASHDQPGDVHVDEESER